MVIVDVPDPSTSQINRLYTRDSSTRCIAAGPGRRGFVLPGQLRGLYQQGVGQADRGGRSDLGGTFKNVLILPGGRNCFLASDGQLTADVAKRIRQAENLPAGQPQLYRRHAHARPHGRRAAHAFVRRPDQRGLQSHPIFLSFALLDQSIHSELRTFRRPAGRPCCSFICCDCGAAFAIFAGGFAVRPSKLFCF